MVFFFFFVVVENGLQQWQVNLSLSLSDWVLGLHVYCFSWNVFLGLFWKMKMYNLIWVYYLPPNFYLFFILLGKCILLDFLWFFSQNICFFLKKKLITVGFIFEGIMRMRMRCGLWFNWWVIIFFPFFFFFSFAFSLLICWTWFWFVCVFRSK